MLITGEQNLAGPKISRLCPLIVLVKEGLEARLSLGMCRR